LQGHFLHFTLRAGGAESSKSEPGRAVILHQNLRIGITFPTGVNQIEWFPPVANLRLQEQQWFCNNRPDNDLGHGVPFNWIDLREAVKPTPPQPRRSKPYRAFFLVFRSLSAEKRALLRTSATGRSVITFGRSVARRLRVERHCSAFKCGMKTTAAIPLNCCGRFGRFPSSF
jgi:hypothetical protein